MVDLSPNLPCVEADKQRGSLVAETGVAVDHCGLFHALPATLRPARHAGLGAALLDLKEELTETALGRGQGLDDRNCDQSGEHYASHGECPDGMAADPGTDPMMQGDPGGTGSLSGEEALQVRGKGLG